MEHFASKLALGTVQFGVDYGISNQHGKVSQSEVAVILRHAHSAGVDLLDTAAAYGESEQVLRQQLAEKAFQFKLVSKLPNCQPEQVKAKFQESVTRLGVQKLYGYLVHNFGWFRQNTRIWETLKDLKAEGKIQKIGFSLYSPEQASWMLEQNFFPDLVQVPYNLFDQRFAELFPNFRSVGIEVHVRSVFLQGLFFVSPENLRPHFFPVKEKLNQVRQIFADNNIPLAAGLLNFAWLCEGIDKLVIGVESAQNLNENLLAEKWLPKTLEIYPELLRLSETNLNIILPTNWK